MKYLRRVWNMTPREFSLGVLRRIGADPNPDPVPGWHRVGRGPLAGGELFLAPTAVDFWQAMADGTHDGFLFDAAAAARPLAGSVVWDVGAHVGYHSLAFAALTGPAGAVVAFEPNPANLERIALHFKRNPGPAARVRVRPAALADTPGRAEFRFAHQVETGLSSGGHLTTSAPPLDLSEYRAFAVADVEVSTIDAEVAAGLPPPDIVKIDVEGAEAAVLRGATATLARHRPVLLIEVHHILQMYEVQSLLTETGYGIEVLDRAGATPSRCFVMARPGRADG